MGIACLRPDVGVWTTRFRRRFRDKTGPNMLLESQMCLSLKADETASHRILDGLTIIANNPRAKSQTCTSEGLLLKT